MGSLDYQDKWQHAKGYQWSSLPGYMSERRVIPVIDYDLLLSMVGGRRAYRAFIIDGLKRGIENPFKKVQNRIILGDANFARKAKRFLKRGSVREQPSYRDLVVSTLEPEVVVGILQRECGISEESLKVRNSNGVIRGIAAELLYKYCEITQAQIGHLLGAIDYMSVSQLRRRLKEKMQQDVEIRKRYAEVEAKLKRLM